VTTVDAHAHVFAAVGDRFPRDVHAELTPPDREATVEQLVAEMEQAGVGHAVLVPLSQHDEYLRFSLDRFPGRFALIGAQGPEPPSVEEYVRRRETAGLQGLRLFGLGGPGETDPERLATFPLLAELARSGDKLWFYGGREQMEQLERVLGVLPELTVVLNHLGYWPSTLSADEYRRPRFDAPYPAEGLGAVTGLARFPRVFVLFAGLYAFAEGPCPYVDLRPVTTALLDAYGPGRLLLGSDTPWIREEPGYAETLASLEAHYPGLDEADRARIRGGNTLDLFAF
jgi:L-fuconolactonase